MARRGFSEKTFRGANPLPPVTDAEVLKKAGLDMLDAARKAPFDLDWSYAPGPDHEYVVLHPGDHLVLRESETKDFLYLLGDLGCAIYPTDCDAVARAEGELAGLKRAHGHYARQGKPRLIELRKTHGLTQEEMEDYRYDHWAYYYNQARADILEEAIKEKNKEIAKLRKEGVAVREVTKVEVSQEEDTNGGPAS
jgi:hypothetical protein